MANPCAKTRPQSDPYEIWVMPNGWRYHVLKKYKGEAGEAKDPYARWLCYVEGDYNETGDVYVTDVTRYGRRVL